MCVVVARAPLSHAIAMTVVLTLEPQSFRRVIPYSRKIWRGIKFGGLAVCVKTAKLKSAKIFYACMYVWQYRTIPPNLFQ